MSDLPKFNKFMETIGPDEIEKIQKVPQKELDKIPTDRATTYTTEKSRLVSLYTTKNFLRLYHEWLQENLE